MNRFFWSRPILVAVASACAVLAPQAARAEGSEDSLSLKIANALRPDKFFMRAGVIYAKIKTKSGDTKDVTGNVISLDELKNVFTQPVAVYTNPGNPNSNVNFNDATFPSASPQDNLTYLFDRTVTGANPYGDGQLLNQDFGIPLLTKYMDDNNLTGIGTPAGIKGVASPEVGTAGVSLGYYLDDDYKWLVETYVLAAPIHASVTIQGTTTRTNEIRGQTAPITRPLGIAGVKNSITTKLLPPTILFGRYWGDKDAKFRPYTGVMGMYAIFADTKASNALNSYVGGSNPGDTTVSIKNTFGMGPVIGFKYQIADAWHASLNIGRVELKTQATLTTRNTVVTSDSTIINDLGGISDQIHAGEGVYNVANPSGCDDPSVCTIVTQNGGLATLITKGIIAERKAAGTGDGNSLGTYVRKTDTTLTNTIFFLSVGRSF